MRFLNLLIINALLFTSIIVGAEGKNHHAALFTGATSGLYTDGHTYMTVGLEYEYKFSQLSPNVGIGFIGEMVFAEHSETVLALPIIVHPFLDLKVFVAPAVILFSESVPEKTDPWNELPVAVESDKEFFVRFGTGWDFHFNQFSVSPLLSVDLIAGKTYLVYGLSFGIGF